MEDMGVLHEVDMVALAEYCDLYARWKEAEECEELFTNKDFIIRTHLGYSQQNQYISIAHSITQRYLKLMQQCAEQLGLPPDED